MKKLVVILMILCTGIIFAQETSSGEVVINDESETVAPAEETADLPKERKNAVSWNTFPLFKGIVSSESNLSSEPDIDFSLFSLALDYERLIVPHISLGADIDMYFGKVGLDEPLDDLDVFYFSLSVNGRYYFMSEKAEKFFLGALIGFNVLSVDGKTSYEDGGFGSIYAEIEAGYRLFFTNMFFVEPSVSYVISKSPSMVEGFGMSNPLPSEWEGGLSIGIAF
jgi:hypothetical protein